MHEFEIKKIAIGICNVCLDNDNNETGRIEEITNNINTYQLFHTDDEDYVTGLMKNIYSAFKDIANEKDIELHDYKPYRLWCMKTYMTLFHIRYKNIRTGITTEIEFNKRLGMAPFHDNEKELYVTHIHTKYSLDQFKDTDTKTFWNLISRDSIRSYKFSNEVYHCVCDTMEMYYGFDSKRNPS